MASVASESGTEFSRAPADTAVIRAGMRITVSRRRGGHERCNRRDVWQERRMARDVAIGENVGKHVSHFSALFRAGPKRLGRTQRLARLTSMCPERVYL